MRLLRGLPWLKRASACVVLLFAAAAPVCAAPAPRLDPAALNPIAQIVQREIRAGHIPGAVVVVGNQGKVVYRRAFGNRMLEPAPVAMTPGTIFDLASLTKVIATTTAVMQLAEAGRLRLDDPIAKYWPDFAHAGKGSITIREALTHYSGLPPDLDERPGWSGYGGALRRIADQRPRTAAETRYIYSDINFEALGEVVHRVSGDKLDVYCARHIFAPLEMRDTCFRPPASIRDRIAPTQYLDGTLRWGVVHDPAAYRMGGVAGHAGLFSTADDLSHFAQMMLDGGIAADGTRVLQPSSIAAMIEPESPRGGAHLRGLGWGLAAPLAANREHLIAAGSYGHSGYTGTYIWIDPLSRTYVIILSNRVYPNGRGDARALRRDVVGAISAALGPVSQAEAVAMMPSLARYEHASSAAPGAMRVLTGAEVLAAQRFAQLTGRRIGLITNRSAVDASGVTTIDLLRHAPGVKLVALFSPEHGLYAEADGKVTSTAYRDANLPVFSLYGQFLRPTAAMLNGIDALVFDVQDAGARFYTYATTMAYAMQAAAASGIDFYVLDRPDPITGAAVQGPVLDANLESFTGYFPMPVRHGMTLGEMAAMFNAENHLGARLHVIAMRNYARSEWFDQTGLAWTPPSPNLRSLDEATLYPGVAMVEGANLSVGRGTASPFEVIGAPWIDSGQFAHYLNARAISGVRFAPADFTPASDAYAHRECHGVRVSISDREALDSPALGIEVASALHRLYPAQFETRRTLGMIGSRTVLDAIGRGDDPQRIERGWNPALDRFIATRARYLLY